MVAISRQMLRDYLHDALPEPEMAAVEKALRGNKELHAQLNAIRDEEDRGEHSVGAIWRRRTSQLPQPRSARRFLLGAGDPELLDYVQFHLDTIGCPYCRANLDDLKKLEAG